MHFHCARSLRDHPSWSEIRHSTRVRNSSWIQRLRKTGGRRTPNTKHNWFSFSSCTAALLHSLTCLFATHRPPRPTPLTHFYVEFQSYTFYILLSSHSFLPPVLYSACVLSIVFPWIVNDAQRLATGLLYFFTASLNDSTWSGNWCCLVLLLPLALVLALLIQLTSFSLFLFPGMNQL